MKKIYIIKSFSLSQIIEILIMITKKFNRIVREIIKVANIIVEVLDARNPLGTRSKRLEVMINSYDDKKLVLFLNKIDLVPIHIIKKWELYLSKEYPTFYGSDRRRYQKSMRFFKGKIMNIIKKRPIHVCLIGYPNVGKSSIINALRGKKVAPISPNAGFTQGEKNIKLTSDNIYLIDTPGVIPYTEESEVELVLKGAIRPDKIIHLMDSVEEIISIIKKEDLIKKYGIEFESNDEFLKNLARKRGKLLPGGVPDINTIAKIFINDFQRGKIPYYKIPPIINGRISNLYKNG